MEDAAVVVVAVPVQRSLRNPAMCVCLASGCLGGVRGIEGGQNRVPCILLIPHCEALHLQIG